MTQEKLLPVRELCLQSATLKRVFFSFKCWLFISFRYQSKKQGSHLAPLTPQIIFPCFPINFLICNPHSLHTMQFSLLPSLPSRHLLLLRVCTGNLQYLPLNLDYENDNLISSVSSESYTPLPRLSFSPILWEGFLD